MSGSFLRILLYQIIDHQSPNRLPWTDYTLRSINTEHVYLCLYWSSSAISVICRSDLRHFLLKFRTVSFVSRRIGLYIDVKYLSITSNASWLFPKPWCSIISFSIAAAISVVQHTGFKLNGLHSKRGRTSQPISVKLWHHGMCTRTITILRHLRTVHAHGKYNYRFLFYKTRWRTISGVA